MSKSFAALLARRFAPLDFSSVSGFPHPVPHMSEWGDFLPVFKEEKEDNPAEHLKKFHECMDLLDLQHEDVRMKMFMHSLYGDARQWYFSLPPSSISSLKDFHRVFNERCKRFFSDKFLFDNCCVEYELHNRVEDVNREGPHSHHLHHLSNDLHDDIFSHKNELDRNNERVQVSPITIISDLHKSEELMSLTTHGEDQFNIGQISIEINEASPQFSDLQTKENDSNHEEQEFQKTYNLQERQQEDYISPYVPFISNFDERDEDDEQIFCNNLGSAADSKDNPQLSDLQTKADFSSYEEEGEEQKVSDHS
jgi:hypothetical protein